MVNKGEGNREAIVESLETAEKVEDPKVRGEIRSVDKEGQKVKIVSPSSEKPQVGFEVDFSKKGEIIVRTFGLLTRDFPNASYDSELDRYWAWSSSQKVGDYDDWQIKDKVEFAAEQLRIKIPNDTWFKEEQE